MNSLAGIVLAAGASSRLGQPKQLVALQGEALVARAAALAQQHCGAGVIVVTGAHHDRVAAVLGEMQATTFFNPRWREGMGASLAHGVGAVHPAATAVMVLLTDQPRIDAEDIERLIAAAQVNPTEICAATYADTVGVPAIFPRRCFDALKNLSDDQGARAVIAAENSVLQVAMPHAEFDLDTPAELADLAGGDATPSA